MGIRFPYFILLLLLTLGIIASILFTPAACLDPAGCLRLIPGQSITIGTSVLTSGSDRPVSLEILQAAQLAVNEYSQPSKLALFIQPFYSTCLPGEPIPASIDLAAAHGVIAVIGPTCTEETADFSGRMSRTSKAVLSPVAWNAAPAAGLLSFFPDRTALLKQAVQRLNQLGYTHLALLADFDATSQAFSKELCAELAAGGSNCMPILAGDILPPDQQVDAVVEIALSAEPAPLELGQAENPNVPKVIISLSRPAIDPSRPAADFWIAPRVWQDLASFIQQYTTAYHNPPISLAAWITYDSVSLIRRSLLNAANSQWDGSLSIPRQSFINQLQKEGQDFGFFKYTCSDKSSNCVDLPMALFQQDGNGYRLANP